LYKTELLDKDGLLTSTAYTVYWYDSMKGTLLGEYRSIWEAQSTLLPIVFVRVVLEKCFELMWHLSFVME